MPNSFKADDNVKWRPISKYPGEIKGVADEEFHAVPGKAFLPDRDSLLGNVHADHFRGAMSGQNERAVTLTAGDNEHALACAERRGEGIAADMLRCKYGVRIIHIIHLSVAEVQRLSVHGPIRLFHVVATFPATEGPVCHARCQMWMLLAAPTFEVPKMACAASAKATGLCRSTRRLKAPVASFARSAGSFVSRTIASA